MQKKFLIGVVLAFLMLPASAGIQENLYYVCFVNIYNNLNTMLRASTAQNGSVAQWNWQKGEDSVFDQYLEPSLTILKECEKTDKSCWQNSYIGLNNKPAPVPSGSHKSYVLSNGASIIFEIKDPNCAKNNETCAYIWVDTNGNKKPNVMGRDMFKFYIHSNANVIYPVGYSYKTGANKQGIEKSCNSMASGFYCGARLLVEKTMAY
jgi:hypothetical protein